MSEQGRLQPLDTKEVPSETVPISLRPWRLDDSAALLTAYQSPDMASQFQEPITKQAAADRWVRRATELINPENGFAFAVVVDDIVIGNAAITRIDSHGGAWVSYWTAASARGRGITTNALRALTQWAHHEQGVFRLELGHRVNNPASCRVAANAGYRVEGIERAKLRYGTERFDVERHAHLTDDPLPAAAGVTIVPPPPPHVPARPV